MSEDVQAHIKLYKKIGVALMVLTVVTVLVSFLPVGVALGVVIALIVATVKGSLVATYFMHLVEERKTCLLYTSPSPRDGLLSRMPSSA